MNEPQWMLEARKELGVKEWPGKNKNNPVVMDYYAEAGHSWVQSDEVPWCAAFVGAMLERAGVHSTRRLNARSYLDWGLSLSPASPEPGCITVFRRGANPAHGHVAFFHKHHGNTIEVLGGNQRNSVNLAHYKTADLLGFRWPYTAFAYDFNPDEKDS